LTTLALSAHDKPNNRRPKDFEPPAVFQAAGPDQASIQGMVDSFRAALGGVNNGNVAGPLDSGRREINWDGGGSTATSEAPTPFTGFLVNRGALFTTPGTGFVQAPVEGLATLFGNPDYATVFRAFSPVRLFSAVNSNVTRVEFFVPGGGDIPALTTGFGAIFSDVDLPDGAPHRRREVGALIKYFDQYGHLLYSSTVPPSPGDGSFSFVGAMFVDAKVAKVVIVSGNAEPGRDDEGRIDVVMMDDFIYGEPRAK
jgi:hypothetical protein